MGCNCNIIKCQCGDCILPQRYIITFMSLLGITFAYSTRICLNIAITKMVVAKPVDENAAPIGKSCPANPTEEKVEIKGGTYEWTEKQQGIILGAFFPGYVITHLPGGVLADSLGGKHVFGGGIFVSAILSILVPVAVQIGGWGLLTALRFGIGLCQGMMYPAALTIVAKWAPPMERSLLGSIITTGSHLGSVTGNLLSSELIAYHGTWQSVFYMWGIVSIIWYVFYMLMCYSEPSQSPFITEKELTMLTTELGGPTHVEAAKIPWIGILTSVPVWAVIISAMGHHLVFYFVSVQMPKYMANVLKLDIKLNGLLSASPYLFLFLCSNFSGLVSDILIRKEIMSVTMCRKVFCTIDCIFPQRYVVTFMSLLGVTFAYSMISVLNIAITKMVVAIAIDEEVTPSDKSCPANPSEEKVEITGGTYDWTEKQQGIILSAYFPGYVITHLPGGILSDSFGGKHVFAGGILCTAIFTVMTPAAVQIGDWQLLAAIRFFIGMSQGVMFPAALTIIAKWAPPVERGLLGSIVCTGAHLGSVTGNLLSSVLIAARGTWQSAFYMWGFVSVTWYVFYLLMCYSEPSQSPFITENELTMLTDVLGGPSRVGGAKIPWIAIVTSLPVWSIITCGVGHDLMFYFVSVQMPKYMANVLKMDIKLNGLLSASPYFFLFIFSNGSAFLSDFIIRKEYLSLSVCRKIFCTIGSVIPGIFLVLASYMECDRKTVVVMFIFSMLTMGPYYPSLRISPADISKNFAGIIMALVNGIGALSYIPVPYITAVLAPDTSLKCESKTGQPKEEPN